MKVGGMVMKIEVMKQTDETKFMVTVDISRSPQEMARVFHVF
jgi:hypothetical protein